VLALAAEGAVQQLAVVSSSARIITHELRHLALY
jgi:hypothetical protein